MTTKVNRILRPPSSMRRLIEIKAYDDGVIQVYPWVIQPDGTRVSMDPREMLLGLLKVVSDTATMLCMGTGPVKIGPIDKEQQGSGATDGEKGNNHNDS